MEMDANDSRAGGPATPPLPPGARELAAAARTWEADIVPIPFGIEEEPDARPAVLFVVAAGFALHFDLLVRPPAEPDAIAGELERATASAAAVVGAWPAVLRVRADDIAAALRPRLAPRDVEVRAGAPLDALDALTDHLVGGMAGLEHHLPMASPESWAGWDLPRETVASLFRAAAAFHRARPWVWLANEQPLEATMPDGRRWTAVALGHAGQQFGLALYVDPADFARTIERGGEPAALLAGFRGRVLTLSFEPRAGLPPAMRREIAASGWEVASPSAYPMLMALNTPAGGVTRRDAADLTAVLEAVPPFVERFRDRLARGERVDWRDEATGVALHHAAVEFEPAGAPWPRPERLEPGGAEGPRARPDAALEPVDDSDAIAARELGAIDRFEASLVEAGLGRATVEKHTRNADAFVDFLAGEHGVPLAAVHEYDLRTFLFDWYPRKSWDARTRALAMPTSLRRFFAFLAEREGIEAPWAERVLAERDAYETRWATFPGGFWWSPDVIEWVDVVTTDLDARVMLHDSGLGGAAEWGETMGGLEAVLDRELERRWLLWRDDVIRAGTASPPEVRAALVARQRRWETSPHPMLDGRSPYDAIAAEREERASPAAGSRPDGGRAPDAP